MQIWELDPKHLKSDYVYSSNSQFLVLEHTMAHQHDFKITQNLKILTKNENFSKKIKIPKYNHKISQNPILHALAHVHVHANAHVHVCF